MRILADLADVKELKKAFKNNEDIHTLTASQVFNIDIKKVDQDMRRKAKAINFGIIYGITQYGLAKQISVSNEEALDLIVDAIEKSKLKPSKDISICLDVAANELINKEGHYSLNSSEFIPVEESINYYKNLVTFI